MTLTIETIGGNWCAGEYAPECGERGGVVTDPANLPASVKQTHGYTCTDCGELWDGYQVPCPMEVALRSMEANRTCIRCGSGNVNVLMPWRYEELKAERRAKASEVA